MNEATGHRPAPLRAAGAADRGLTPKMLHHYARITHDVEAIADFYTRVLGMELCSTILDDRVPSTGDAFPYFHVFFRMADGSCVAFFECAEVPGRPAPTHPAYPVFDHFAFQANDLDELHHWRDWLISQGVEVIGPVDHKGFVQSIYFHDPEGYRLELTVPTGGSLHAFDAQPQEDLRRWVETKRAARAAGADPTQALVEMIRAVKADRYSGHNEH